MRMERSSELFEAFLKCPTKCWLQSRGETCEGNAYAEWVKMQNESYRAEGVRRLQDTVPEGERVVAPTTENLKGAKWRLAVDFVAQASAHASSSSVSLPERTPCGIPGQPLDEKPVLRPQPDPWILVSRLHAVERLEPEGRGKPAQFIPIRFIYRNKLTRDDRLLVAFDALVLSGSLGRDTSLAKISHGDDHATLQVKTAGLLGKARKLAVKMAEMLAGDSPPDLVLNRHCGECEFREQCRQNAFEKDDLSLLAHMTAKERKKYHSEGIFTVTQLSCTFRPRRRPKRLKDKREKYHHALKALAIREKKIHIVGTPELKVDGTPVYLDVEGLPDREFYYLIGLRAKSGDTNLQHWFWADDFDDEKRVWNEFLGVLAAIEKPVLIHYGSYETVFLKRMLERYGGLLEGSPVAKAVGAAINLVSFLFAQFYFPTCSNGLKDIAGWLGFQWSGVITSGTQSIIWRTDWQKSGDPSVKQRLISYNSEDCQALQLLTETLVRLCSSDCRANLDKRIDSTAVFADSSPAWDTLWGQFTTPIEDFEVINKAARWDFQRDKVYIRTDKLLRRPASSRPVQVKRINKEVICESLSTCPFCRRKSLRKLSDRTKILYDIRFSEFGIRRWVVKYHFHAYWCYSCHRSVGVPEAFWPQSKFGRSLVRFVVFETIELCVPQLTVAQAINRLFGLGLKHSSVNQMKSRAAEYYLETRQQILAKMIKGELIHADETPIVLKHKREYVWVFTSLHEVVYFHTETREGRFVEQTLKDFKGVLVSDFYAPYNTLPCPQQKCLIHLIRDLNNEVLDHPYDEELKRIVLDFAELLRAIVQTIDRWGLKRRFLGKHLIGVDRFYGKIVKSRYRSEAALRWKERFVKNRDGLFTFLSHDGIPWNNNNAEHAIKAFARLRRAILGLSTPKGIDEYLILLSICQTCKYQGLDFLDFLRSGETDMQAFAENRPRRNRPKPEQPF